MVQRAHLGRRQTLQNTLVFTPGSVLELHFTRLALIWHIFGSTGRVKNAVKYSVWRPREAFAEALGISQTPRFSMFLMILQFEVFQTTLDETLFWLQRTVKKTW